MQTDSGKQHFWHGCLVKKTDHISVDADAGLREAMLKETHNPSQRGDSERWFEGFCSENKLSLLAFPWARIYESVKNVRAALGRLSVWEDVWAKQWWDTHPDASTHNSVYMNSTHIKRNTAALGSLGKRSSTRHALINCLDWKNAMTRVEILNAYINIRLQLVINNVYFAMYAASTPFFTRDYCTYYGLPLRFDKKT